MSFPKTSELQQVSDAELKILLQLLESALNLPGDLVELGCYRGDSSLAFARLLARWNQTQSSLKQLWLYDSFAGLPPKTREDSSIAGDQFRAGELAVTKREVVEKFKRAGLRVPKIRKAFFDELDPVADFPPAICFGFLDGDLYGSIKTSLALTQNKVVPGGILVIHDYDNPELPGVTRAVEEWLTHFRSRLSGFEKRETLAILKF